MRKFRWVVPLALAGLCMMGCQSSHKPTEDAVKRWNEARASVLAGLAEHQYKSGQFDQARKTLDQAVVLTPDSAKLHVLSARIALEQGQLELAQREAAQAQQLDPKNAQADYCSGIVYQRWQKPATALQYYTSASEKAPTELAYVLARSEMMVALDQSDKALALLQSKLVYFENSAALRDAMGMIYMNQGKYAQASEFFGQASVFADDDLVIREHYALSLYLAREYRRAVPVFERLSGDKAIESRPDLQQAMGECLMHVGRSRDALEHFQSAVRLDANQASAWVALAQCEMELGDLQLTREALRRALSLAPTSAQANLLMGYVCLRGGELDGALKAFKAASRADPHDSTSSCMVGYVLQKQGRTAEARQWYDAALKLSPHDELASRLLADVE